MAMAGSPLWSITQWGVDEAGKPFSNLFFFNGGMGATATGDGESCMSWPSNISSTPTEVMEKLSPLRVLYRGLVPGSGGGHGPPGERDSVATARDRILGYT